MSAAQQPDEGHAENERAEKEQAGKEQAGQELQGEGEVMDALHAIRARRSISRLAEPAPSGDDLRTILEAGTCAPDHGELRPWRFILLQGEAKDAFGEVLRQAYVERCAQAGVDPHPKAEEKELTKLGRAPLVVAVAAVRKTENPTIPWIEMKLSAGCVVENMMLAATALGYGSMWRTGPAAYDRRVMDALGLGPDDELVGFCYLGTIAEASGPKPAHEPVLDGLVETWQPR